MIVLKDPRFRSGKVENKKKTLLSKKHDYKGFSMTSLGENSNFLKIPSNVSDLNNSKIAVISAPYEATVSYGKGTAKGPKAIINASHYVEFYDEEFDNELCFKTGITTLKQIDFKKQKNLKALDLIYKNVKSLLDKDKFVVTLGGEHTICIAPIKAYFEKFPDLSILHFDAHSDLRESYENNKYSHASALARVCDFFPPQKLVQVGIRAQCIEESRFIKERGVNTFYAWEIRTGKYGSNWQKEIASKLGNSVYITFDIDYFDPSIMPSTGTPEPNGFYWNETLEIFREIRRQNKKIVGFDVVEFAPKNNIHHPDMLAAKLVYKMMNFAF
jgi:agmatinase